MARNVFVRGRDTAAVDAYSSQELGCVAVYLGQEHDSPIVCRVLTVRGLATTYLDQIDAV